MPVYNLRCPDCSHEFKGMVLEHTKPPEFWVCSKCLSKNVEPVEDREPEPHPWEGSGHGGGCLCCGPAKRSGAGR